MTAVGAAAVGAEDTAVGIICTHSRTWYNEVSADYTPFSSNNLGLGQCPGLLIEVRYCALELNSLSVEDSEKNIGNVWVYRVGAA